jgi:dTMP kinase
MTRGRFITFEGLDGAGKSTHIANLAARLRIRGHEVVVTREPGGTSLGERVRELVLNEAMHLETETLLMFAARREHVAQVIEPALTRGAWVVCDRFTDATRAYQGGGRGVDREKIEQLAQWVHCRANPDLTLLFDISHELARQRIAGGRVLDRFEREQALFHHNVRERYLELAAAEPARFRIVDAAKSVGEIDKILENIASSI